MSDLNIGQITETSMKTSVPSYQVLPKVIDEAGAQKETYFTNPDWPIYLGYLDSIPEFWNAARSLAIWACGKGWNADTRTTNTLKLIRGWGKETFDEIIITMIMEAKANGQSYAEIVKHDGILINLIKLNPSRVRHVIGRDGLITRFDVMDSNGEYKPFKLEDIFMLTNDRIANQTHGTSVLKSCKWIIDWKNEMMNDLRRVMHRSTIRVIYVPIDDTTRLNLVKSEYASAIKNGELLIIPAKPGEAEFQDLNIPPTEAWMNVIRFVDNYFYEVLNVSKVITGGTQDNTEASSKMGYMSFEVPYSVQARIVEEQIKIQLGLEIEFEKPASLKENVQEDEAKNTGQVGIQPNAMQPPTQMPMMAGAGQ